jgi:hypothetical protein
MADLETLAHHTLLLLEQRLARLEFLLAGHATPPTNGAKEGSTKNPKSIQYRLRALDRALNSLTVSSPLLRLCKSLRPRSRRASPTNASSADAALPDLAAAPPPADSPPPPTPAAATALLLPALPTIHSTASQLRALADASPSSAGSGSSSSKAAAAEEETRALVRWAALAPRVERAARRQREIGAEAAELRRRSARAVVRWHEGWVLGAGRCWVEWEGRVRRVEREVGRVEARRG